MKILLVTVIVFTSFLLVDNLRLSISYAQCQSCRQVYQGQECKEVESCPYGECWFCYNCTKNGVYGCNCYDHMPCKDMLGCTTKTICKDKYETVCEDVECPQVSPPIVSPETSPEISPPNPTSILTLTPRLTSTPTLPSGCQLTSKNAPHNLRVARLQSNEATLTWVSESGGNQQWFMLDTNRSRVENDCVGGCLVNKRDLWDDQTVYVFGQSHGIKPDTTYYWKVVEVNTSIPNCRADSSIATFTTPKDCFAPESRLYVKGPGEVVFDLKANGTSQTFNGDQLDYYVTSTGKGQNIDFFREFTWWDLRHILKNQWQYHTKTVTIPVNFEHYGGNFYVILKTSKRNSTIYFDDVAVEVNDPNTGSFVPITKNSGFEQGSNGSIPTDWRNNSWLADHNNFKTGSMEGVNPKSGSGMLHVELGNEYGHHGSEVIQTFSEDLRGQTVRISGWTYSKDNLVGDYQWAGIALGYWVVEGGDIEKIHYGVDGNLQVYEVPIPQPPEPRRSAKVPDQAFTGSGTHVITYYAQDACQAVESTKTFEFTLLGPTPTPTLTPSPTPTVTPTTPPPPPPAPGYLITHNGDVHANRNIQLKIPSGKFLADFIVSHANFLCWYCEPPLACHERVSRNDLNLTSSASPYGTINYPFLDKIYDYFPRINPSNPAADKQTNNFTQTHLNQILAQLSPIATIKPSTGTTVKTSQLQLTDNQKAVLYIQGNLEIMDDILIADSFNSGLVWVIEGDVKVAADVEKMDGLYLTDGEFKTTSSNKKLESQGSVILGKNGSWELKRAVADDVSEEFVLPPQYYLLFDELMGVTKYLWREVKP